MYREKPCRNLPFGDGFNHVPCDHGVKQKMAREFLFVDFFFWGGLFGFLILLTLIFFGGKMRHEDFGFFFAAVFFCWPGEFRWGSKSLG